MSKLVSLRSRLGALRRRRRNARRQTAWFGWLSALLGTLGGLFLFDWLFEPAQSFRLLFWAALVAAVFWSWRRLAAPWLARREDELDMALLVERQQRIDSDLVAALQFEQPEAAQWGSGQLRTAVIDYVAEFGQEIDVFQGFDRREMVRRARWFAIAALATLVLVLACPRHVAVFFQRLALGRAHYPTQTQIERVLVSGRPAWDERRQPLSLVAPAGQPLQFEVLAAGVIPTQGQIRLRTVDDQQQTLIDLAADSSQSTLFNGELPRLIEDLWFEVYLGDAWTDPQRIAVLPLPIVQVNFTVTAPPYAIQVGAADEAPLPVTGERQLTVLEGSRVDLELVGVNKPLRSATLIVGEKRWELVAADPEQRRWTLVGEEHPWRQVADPTSFTIEVLDADGLRPEHPVQGFLRTKSDRPPQIDGQLVTRRVLPTARPKLRFAASDDFAVRQVRLHRQAVRGGVTGMEDEAIDVPVENLPLDKVQGTYVVDLGPLGLAKGDQLKLTLEAVDFRGDRPGKAVMSEPLFLEVTDERGILAGMIESDEKLARELDSVIQRQTGIGESR